MSERPSFSSNRKLALAGSMKCQMTYSSLRKISAMVGSRTISIETSEEIKALFM